MTKKSILEELESPKITDEFGNNISLSHDGLLILEGINEENKMNKNHPYETGTNYFVRTVTNFYTGKLVAVTDKELVLESAAWIADTGRFADALEKGTLSEVEPYPEGTQVIVNRDALCDASIWKHPLPRTQK